MERNATPYGLVFWRQLQRGWAGFSTIISTMAIFKRIMQPSIHATSRDSDDVGEISQVLVESIFASELGDILMGQSDEYKFSDILNFSEKKFVY